MLDVLTRHHFGRLTASRIKSKGELDEDVESRSVKLPAARSGGKGQLIGFEVTVDRDDDPCEVCLWDYREVNGHRLPSRFQVRYKGKRYGEFELTAAELK